MTLTQRIASFVIIALGVSLLRDASYALSLCSRPVPMLAHQLMRQDATAKRHVEIQNQIQDMIREFCAPVNVPPVADSEFNIGRGCTMYSGNDGRDVRMYWATCGNITATPTPTQQPAVTQPSTSPGSVAPPLPFDARPFTPSGIKKASIWTHSGSLLYLVADGPIRRFFYERPSEALRIARVRDNALLFDGRKDEMRYTGTVRAYFQNCLAQSYIVSGLVSEDLRTVTLSGKAPQLNAQCRAIGTREEMLVFEFKEAFQ